jgi:hypothetical protein
MEACARRAEAFFQLLGRCDPAWNRWQDNTTVPGTEREQLVKPDAEAFMRMFRRKENQLAENGYQFWMWAGDTLKGAASVNGRCGASSAFPASACVMEMPTKGPVASRVLTANGMAAVLRAMALAWDPEWGIATSEKHRDLVASRPKAGNFVGWVMYFSRYRGRVPRLPDPVRVEPVEDRGTLVILTPEVLTVTNREHVELAADVHEMLDDAGLLRRLRPWGLRSGRASLDEDE